MGAAVVAVSEQPDKAQTDQSKDNGKHNDTWRIHTLTPNSEPTRTISPATSQAMIH